jgi:hypothetical protein
MDRAARLYADALETLELALAAPSPVERAMLLTVAICIRDHAREFSSAADGWPPSPTETSARAQ